MRRPSPKTSQSLANTMALANQVMCNGSPDDVRRLLEHLQTLRVQRAALGLETHPEAVFGRAFRSKLESFLAVVLFEARDQAQTLLSPSDRPFLATWEDLVKQVRWFDFVVQESVALELIAKTKRNTSIFQGKSLNRVRDFTVLGVQTLFAESNEDQEHRYVWLEAAETVLAQALRLGILSDRHTVGITGVRWTSKQPADEATVRPNDQLEEEFAVATKKEEWRRNGLLPQRRRRGGPKPGEGHR